MSDSGGTPATVIITIDIDDLLNKTGYAVTSDGTLIRTDTVRELTDSAEIYTAFLTQHGEVLRLGRTRRIATRSQTIALHARDGGCSFPGCDTAPEWCERHHIIGWADGGMTDLNKVDVLPSLTGILTAVAVVRRMSRQIEPLGGSTVCLGVPMRMLLLLARRASLFVVVSVLVALTGAQSAQALTVEHDEGTFPVEETMEGACAFDVAVSGSTSFRVTAFRDDGILVKVILHFSSTLTFSANGQTISAKERINQFDVDFDPSGGAPSTTVRTGVFPISHLPGGGTIVEAGRIVEDLTTGSIVFEKGNLNTEGDVSAFCEALS